MNYIKSKKIVSYVLLLALLLESCLELNTNPKNAPLPNKAYTPKLPIKEDNLVTESTFKTPRGEVITFDKEKGKYVANLEGHLEPISVVVADNTLVEARKIKDKKERRKFLDRRIAIQGKRVIIVAQGLLGGMEGKKDKGKEKEESEEDENKETDENNEPLHKSVTSKPLKGEEKEIFYQSATAKRKGLEKEREIVGLLNRELEGEYQLGEAEDMGDCFFDALAQQMNIRNDTDVNTTKYLRSLCHDYYLRNKAAVDGWNQADYGGIHKGGDDYYMVHYTYQECQRDFNGRSPIWGRPWVEGRTLIHELGIERFLVVEVLEDAETGKPVASYHLVTKDGYKSMDAERFRKTMQEGEIPVLVNAQNSLHYVPLLNAGIFKEGSSSHTEVVEQENKKLKIEEKTIEVACKLDISIEKNVADRDKGKEKEGSPKRIEQNQVEKVSPSIAVKEQEAVSDNLLGASSTAIEEDAYQRELRDRIISQASGPAIYKQLQLELYKQVSCLSSQQREELNKLIKCITPAEKKLRLGARHEIREDFRMRPSLEHNLFAPIRLLIKDLEGYAEKLVGTPVVFLIEELIRYYTGFAKDLTEKVSQLGTSCPLSLFEPKALLEIEGHAPYEIDLVVAYQMASYKPEEYDFVRKNSSGNSIGGEYSGVYYKVDNGMGLLRPAREAAVYSFYNKLLGNKNVTPTRLIALNGLPILNPRIDESLEAIELAKRKRELGVTSSQEVFDKYPELERRVAAAQQEQPIFIQASSFARGSTLEKFLEATENNTSLLEQINIESFSSHILSSLLLLPTDYKADNLVVEAGSGKILGIDNDAALEKRELRKLTSKMEHLITARNVLYMLPLMQEKVNKSVQAKVVEHNAGLLLLEWLVEIWQQQKQQDKFLEYSLVDSNNLAVQKQKIAVSLDIPIQFNKGWVLAMYDRLQKIQQLLSKADITHQALFEAVHPFASRYYQSLAKMYPLPLDRIAATYPPQDMALPALKTLEEFLREDPMTGDAGLREALATYDFSSRPFNITIAQGTEELLGNIDLKDYTQSQKLVLLEKVAALNIWPARLHSSWQEPHLLLELLKAGSSKELIEALIARAKLDINITSKEGGVLHAAVTGSNPLEQIPVLLALGARIEEQDSFGLTALDIAAERKDIATFKCLVEHGAGAKAVASKISRLYKNLKEAEKEQIKASIEKLVAINPKIGWKISLDEIFPPQRSPGAKLIRTVTEGNRYISPEAYNQLFTIDGTPCKPNAEGIRPVPFIERKGRRIYVKFYPQLPGTETAVNKLAEGLFGYCTPYSELAFIGEVPVLLTQGVPGETIYSVLTKSPRKLEAVDPVSISKAIVLAMLINPGDGNLGNYIVPVKEKGRPLISIDNDQAFMPGVARSIKKGMFSATLSLQVKTILYCLEQMREKVAREVIEAIKGINILEVLKGWLSNLKIYHQATVDVFNSGVVRRYRGDITTLIGISFAPGMMKELFTKLVRLQKAVSKQKTPTHLALLEIVEPYVASRYKPFILKPTLTALERYKQVEHIVNEKDLTSSSNLLSRLLESREIPNLEQLQEAIWQGRYGPGEATNELEEVIAQHTSLEQILKDLGRANLTGLRGCAEGTLEKLLKEADFSKISTLQQEALLRALQNKELRYIRLVGCRALTGSIVNSLTLTHVKKLDLAGCNNLTNISTGLLGNYPVIMPQVIHVRLNRSGITSLHLEAENLKILELKDCQKLKKIQLIAPKLQKLYLKGAEILDKQDIKKIFRQFPYSYIYFSSNKEFPNANKFLYDQFLQYIDSNNELASHYLKQSADQGFYEAIKNIEKLALAGCQVSQAWIAEKGDKNAQYKLGQIYEEGKGLKKDLDKAATWYVRTYTGQKEWYVANKLKELAFLGIKVARQWLIEEAEKGDKDAQYKLGQIYEEGKGLEKDLSKAGIWYIKAAHQGEIYSKHKLKELALSGIEVAQQWLIEEAEKGDKDAQYKLGQIYEEGKRLEKDLSKAAIWYIKAAHQGEIYSKHKLKELALLGIKVAQQWLIQEAEKGDKDAQYKLGQIYEEGKGLEKDLSKAGIWYIKAAHQGEIYSKHKLKELALSGIEVAQQWLIEEAEKGDKDAQYKLGQIYKEGKGLEKDLSKAAIWYIKAAHQGEIYSKHKLKELALLGIEVAQQWLIEEAEKGDKDAQCKLGQIYEEGKRLEKDLDKAATWYVRAYTGQKEWYVASKLKELALLGIEVAQQWLIEEAEKGDKDAQYKLGQIYKEGKGLEKDLSKAATWYVRAYTGQEEWYVANKLKELALSGIEVAQQWLIEEAEKGDKDAQYKLGQIYEEGKRLEKDLSKAAIWYIKAAHQGEIYSKHKLKELALLGIEVAQQWLIEEAEKGDKDAQYKLGQIYEEGKGLEKDLSKAGIWYIKAAHQGEIYSKHKLKELALSGIEVAQQWLIEEAEKGDKDAQYKLGQIYEEGKRLEKDLSKAAIWYIKAAHQGEIYSKHKLKELALLGIEVAQQWLIEEAEKGDKNAQCKLGQIYEEGKRLEKDLDKAATWYVRAYTGQKEWYVASKLKELALLGIEVAQQWLIEEAEKGDKDAQYKLGQIYKEGKGLEKDLSKAATWYVRAYTGQEEWYVANKLKELALSGIEVAQQWLIEEAEKGDKDAQYKLGQIYKEGKGLEKDLSKAATWYVRAYTGQEEWYVANKLKELALLGIEVAQQWLIEEAEKGDKDAQYKLGQIYEEGKGLEKDLSKAGIWYIKAAHQGEIYSKRKLKELALSGIEVAQQWLIQEAEKGDKDAQYKLGQIYEEGKRLEKDLSKAATWYVRAYTGQKEWYVANKLEELALSGIEVAQQWLIQEAEKGDKDSQYKLGQIYEEGKGLEKDLSKAAIWYIKAAHQGKIYSKRKLKKLALLGIEAAQQWLIQEAEKGDKNAQYKLGQIYEEGKGLEKDLSKAAIWYIKAAHQGEIYSKHKLKKLALLGIEVAQQWLIQQVEKGDKNAQYKLGQIYEEGKGLEKDLSKAAIWYIKAAHQGEIYSKHKLEELALSGIEVAQQWLIEEAEKGDKDAQYKLGQIYEEGKGLDKDLSKAATWYVRTYTGQKEWYVASKLKKLALLGIEVARQWLIQEAEKGDKNAQYKLGQIYEEGKGLEKDLSKAAIWYIKGAHQGEIYSKHKLEELALLGIEAAQQWLIQQAEKGDKNAQYKLGQIYEEGKGLEKDLSKAGIWYIKAAHQGKIYSKRKLEELALLGIEVAQQWLIQQAEKGDPSAQLNLGYMYCKGKRVAVDRKKAFKWFSKAAQQGYAEAQFSLGCRYDNGEGIVEDKKEAVKWYQKAAEQGHAKAQFNLGLMHYNGEGVVVDKEEALKWFRKAAYQGNAKAQVNLGLMYDKGERVAVDRAEALKWFRKAADQGNAKAQFNLELMYDNGEETAEDKIEAVQ